MTVKIYWGARPAVVSEIHFLEQLDADLTGRGVSAIVLANFFTRRGHRQIDFLVITPVHVCHVELKHYTEPLVGQLNGPWSSRRPDGSLEVIDRPNPYGQALECKFALSDDMHALAETGDAVPRSSDRRFYRQFDSVVCIFPRLAEGSEVPDDYKVRTLGYSEFLDFLIAPGPRPDWNRDDWSAFVGAQGLTQATAPQLTIADEAAFEVVEGYTRHFIRFYRPRLHELVPLPLVAAAGSDPEVVSSTMPSTELSDLVLRVPHVQLVGLSGSGKSHLAKHTALALTNAGHLAVLVEAGLYEGRLSALLDRCVGRHCAVSAAELLRAAAANGRRLMLVVDGLNECPQPLQERLLGDLSALCLRIPVRTLVTGQAGVEVPDTLGGITLTVGELGEEDRRAVLVSHGGAPEVLAHCEPFSTAYELSIAAECAVELVGVTTRATLFDAFLRKRLSATSSPAYVRRVLRHLAVMMDRELTAWLSVDDVRRICEQTLITLSAPLGVVDEVLACSVVVVRQGRFSFSHELLGRFLTAEALLLDHLDTADLVRELDRPRHRDLAPLILPLVKDAGRVRQVVIGLADTRVFAGALLGDYGQVAARVVHALALDLLDSVTGGLADTTFTVPEWHEVGITGGHQLGKHEPALIGAIGIAVFHGRLVEQAVALLDATDEACRRALRTDSSSARALAVSQVVSAVVAGASKPESTTAARILLDSYEAADIDHRFRRREATTVDLDALIEKLIQGARSNSYGRLLLVCAMLNAADGIEPSRHLPSVLRLCWDSNAYHLRLAALMAVERFASRLDGHPLRDRIVEILDEFGNDRLDLGVSTQLVDTMHVYDMLEPSTQIDQVRSEVEEVLRGEWTREQCERAYGIVSTQFEEVIGSDYFTVVDSLAAAQKTTLYTMAALGSPSCAFWNDWLLVRLIDLGDARAAPAFERWATELDTDTAFIQGVGNCYALAMVGSARLMDAPLRLQRCQSIDDQAWQCYGEIIFWLHKPGLPADEVARRCASSWQRLTADLAPAAADALHWLTQPGTVTRSAEQTIFTKLVNLFRDDVRTVLEWSLAHHESLTSIFGYRSHGSPVFGAAGLPDYVIRTLRHVGNEGTVELLRSYVDHPILGTSAIDTIRGLTDK